MGIKLDVNSFSGELSLYRPPGVEVENSTKPLENLMRGGDREQGDGLEVRVVGAILLQGVGGSSQLREKDLIRSIPLVFRKE